MAGEVFIEIFFVVTRECAVEQCFWYRGKQWLRITRNYKSKTKALLKEDFEAGTNMMFQSP
jgi:hypothetical protein